MEEERLSIIYNLLEETHVIDNDSHELIIRMRALMNQWNGRIKVCSLCYISNQRDAFNV